MHPVWLWACFIVPCALLLGVLAIDAAVASGLLFCRPGCLQVGVAYLQNVYLQNVLPVLIYHLTVARIETAEPEPSKSADAV